MIRVRFKKVTKQNNKRNQKNQKQKVPQQTLRIHTKCFFNKKIKIDFDSLNYFYDLYTYLIRLFFFFYVSKV